VVAEIAMNNGLQVTQTVVAVVQHRWEVRFPRPNYVSPRSVDHTE
jgi:hypothetical protein